METVINTILTHPFNFLIICIGIFIICYGISAIFRSVGADTFFPLLINFLKDVCSRLYAEFTKNRHQRTAIEDINFLLILFFGIVAVISVIFVLFPSALTQLCSTTFSANEKSIDFLTQSLMFLILTGFISPILTMFADKDSAIRSLASRVLHSKKDE